MKRNRKHRLDLIGAVLLTSCIWLLAGGLGFGYFYDYHHTPLLNCIAGMDAAITDMDIINLENQCKELK